MTNDPGALAATYFRAWKAMDFATLRSILATWFDLHTSVAAPCPTANWSHVEDGKIKAIRVTFDARELAPQVGQ